MKQLNISRLAPLVVILIGGVFAFRHDECRLPYVEKVLPAALMASCARDDDSNPPSDSEKKLKGKAKP
ncbi:hypothetical protein [Anabaena sp. CCY 0017]|uniref:hypothetical protein n=1 Tax=Anabaena sp. CCY 0017 TaxID=3103866 RepID=UPI0039C7397E